MPNLLHRYVVALCCFVIPAGCQAKVLSGECIEYIQYVLEGSKNNCISDGTSVLCEHYYQTAFDLNDVSISVRKSPVSSGDLLEFHCQSFKTNCIYYFFPDNSEGEFGDDVALSVTGMVVTSWKVSPLMRSFNFDPKTCL